MLRRIFVPAVLSCALCGAAAAQSFTTFASGLINPAKIVTGPNGTLLVSEAGTAANSGRVSLLDSAGNRRTLIDGLPAGASPPNGDADGPNGLALQGRTLYIEIGEGDTHVNGPQQGQIVPNPNGPSSPLFDTIVSVSFSNDPDLLVSGFSLTPRNQFTLLDGTPVTLSNSSGDTASLQLVTAFRPDIPDPQTIYRNSHPYGLGMLPSRPDVLYVADAGMNTVVQVNIATGHSQLVTRFANGKSPLPAGKPFIEAVPTSIRAYGDSLLVSLLSGAPFVPGQSRIMAVDPATGNSSVFIAELSSATDVLYRQKADGTSQWLVLQYSKQLLAGAPGNLLSYTSAQGQVLTDNIPSPTSMTLDAGGNLYITDRANGKVLLVHVGP